MKRTIYFLALIAFTFMLTIVLSPISSVLALTSDKSLSEILQEAEEKKENQDSIPVEQKEPDKNIVPDDKKDEDKKTIEKPTEEQPEELFEDDTIALQMLINDGAQYTNSDLVKLSIINESLHAITAVRTVSCSQISECDYEKEYSWNNWMSITFTGTSAEVFDYVMHSHLIGEKKICVQAKTSANTISPIFCDTIIFDNIFPTGSIVIDPDGTADGADSTVDPLVTIELKEFDTTVFSTTPERPRVSIAEWLVANPTAKKVTICHIPKGNPANAHSITISVNALKKHIDHHDDYIGECITEGTGSITPQVYYSISSNGTTWSEWTLISDTTTIADYNLGISFGTAQVFVKFKDDANNISPVYIDSINVVGNFTGDISTLPIYKAEYIPVVGNTPINSYTFTNVPTSFQTNLQFTLVFDVENLGSLIWYPVNLANASTNPVNISYHWINADTGQYYVWDGNRAFLNTTIEYSETHPFISLPITMPHSEGNYILQIDAVHEGVTWFSQKGNYMPSFNIFIDDPNYPVVDPEETGLPDYEGEFGLGTPGVLDPQVEQDTTSGLPPLLIPLLLYEPSHVCNARLMDVFAYPSWGSPIISTVGLGYSVYKIDEQKVGSDVWVKIMMFDGKIGWILNSFVCTGFDTSPTYNVYENILFDRPYDSSEVIITSDFGTRNKTFHTGVDYGISCGTEINAIESGTVIETFTEGIVAGNESTIETSSNYVKILHENQNYQSWYWHLEEVYVKPGDKVTKGDPIGTSGNTGYVRGDANDPLEEQGCHLHFEIRSNDPQLVDLTHYYALDPELFLQYSDLNSDIVRLLYYRSGNYGEIPGEDKITPVYRLWRESTQSHLYTTSADERDSIVSNGLWVYEGVAYYAYKYNFYTKICSGGTPVIRFYNATVGRHFYTIDLVEDLTIQFTNPQWLREGVAYCAYKTNDTTREPETRAVHRFFNEALTSHFFTISQSEKQYIEATNPNWEYEHEAFYAFPIDEVAKARMATAIVAGEYVAGQDALCTGWKQTIFRGDTQVADLVFYPDVGIFRITAPAATYAYYNETLNDPCRNMGLPLRNAEDAAKSPQGTTGTWQLFERGRIYESSKGTFAVFGKISEKYETVQSENGLTGTRGSYGFPTSAIYPTYNGYCQDFQGGSICTANSLIIPDNIKLIIDAKVDSLNGFYDKNEYKKVCDSYKLKIYNESGSYSGEIIYNPNNGNAYYINSIRVINKYYSIIDYCTKLGYPARDTSKAAIGQKPTYYGDNVGSDVIDAYWNEFERGHIYDYKTITNANWQTYAIWNPRILENYSSSGSRGFPTSDTQEEGLQNCIQGIIYQRFEFSVVSLLDDIRIRNIDDNRRFESSLFNRRNNNLTCAYLNSHLSTRHIISDNDAYKNIVRYIDSQGGSDQEMIKDILVVLIGYERIGSGAGYEYEGTEDNLYHSSLRGSNIQNHDVFSDTGLKYYFRDSKYHTGENGFGYNTSKFSSISDELRSNQLFHLSGGTVAGWDLSSPNWPQCTLSLTAVEFHEMVEPEWSLSETPKNGGSMEDLIINYITAYTACKLRQNPEYISREDFIEIHTGLGQSTDKMKHVYVLASMGSDTLLSNETEVILTNYIYNNDK